MAKDDEGQINIKVCLHTAAGFTIKTFSDLCACKSMLKVKSNSQNIPLLSDYTHINTESICSPDADMLVTFLMYHF